MRRYTKMLLVGFVVFAVVAGVLAAKDVLPALRAEARGEEAWGYEAYNETWTLPLEGQSAFDMELSSVDVVIESWDGSEIQIDFDGKRRQSGSGFMPEVQLEAQPHGILIRESREDFAIHLSPLKQPAIRGTLTVRLPEGQWGDGAVDTFSGNIQIEGLTLDSLRLSTSSGKITAGKLNVAGKLTLSTFSGSQGLSGIQAGEVGLDSSSGKLTLKGIEAEGLNATTFSGSITLEEVEAAGDVALGTSSGSIVATAFQANELSANSFSGKIRLEGQVEKALSVDSSSGSVTVVLSAPCKQVDIDTFSGKVSLALSSQTGISGHVDTFSGKVTLPEGVLEAQGREADFVIGQGGQSVRVSTSSGSVIIETQQGGRQF